VKRLGHVSSLDGLRGVAILAVIGMHYFDQPKGGFYGVDLFFALSGFLITTLLLEERDRTGRIALAAFYRRRAHRLLPGLFTVLAAYAVAMWSSPVRALEQIAAGAFYTANIVLASGSHLLDDTPLVPFWSLAQEEQFYLLWPLLLALLLTRRVRESRIARTLACVLIVLAAYRVGLRLAGASALRLYCGPDTHADALGLGCLLALLRRGGFRVPQVAGWLGLAALLVAFALLSPTAGPIAYGLAPMSIAGALLVGAALEPGLLSRCLSFRPLVWLGVISYSLYLWHLFFFWLLDWREPLLALPLTLVVATFCYYKVESPLRTAFRPRLTPTIEAQPASGHA
jgi:peptidoglycan/LPS O-acetylase OafA/YrhL